VAPLLGSNLIFLGPGSPTYAARQLQDSLAWQVLTAQHRLGSAIVLASAATVAASAHTLPVYEIYKVGEELHWQTGLDFFGPYGLSLVFIPHWNNTEGGADLDTSRCFMGQARFEELMSMLAPQTTVVGIDEHTALVVDLQTGKCQVMGKGGVALLREGKEQQISSGCEFPVTELGPFRMPQPQTGVPPEVWQSAQGALARSAKEDAPEPPAEVLALIEEREAARANHNWAHADDIRERITALGWYVSDTPQGPRLEPKATRP
jgi:hypothetical protein